jgi:hypothetical protein
MDVSFVIAVIIKLVIILLLLFVIYRNTRKELNTREVLDALRGTSLEISFDLEGMYIKSDRFDETVQYLKEAYQKHKKLKFLIKPAANMSDVYDGKHRGYLTKPVNGVMLYATSIPSGMDHKNEDSLNQDTGIPLGFLCKELSSQFKTECTAFYVADNVSSLLYSHYKNGKLIREYTSSPEADKEVVAKGTPTVFEKKAIADQLNKLNQEIKQGKVKSEDLEWQKNSAKVLSSNELPLILGYAHYPNKYEFTDIYVFKLEDEE